MSKPTSKPGWLNALLAAVVAVGCTTEVPYDAVADANAPSEQSAEGSADEDAPASDDPTDTQEGLLPFEAPNDAAAQAEVLKQQQDVPMPGMGPETLADVWDLNDEDLTKPYDKEAADRPAALEGFEPEPTDEPESDPEPQAAPTPMAESSDVGLPWERNQQNDSDASAEAAKFFGGLGAQAPAPTEPSPEPTPSVSPTMEQPAEQEAGNAFGSFLDDAYSDLPVAQGEEVDELLKERDEDAAAAIARRVRARLQQKAAAEAAEKPASTAKSPTDAIGLSKPFWMPEKKSKKAEPKPKLPFETDATEEDTAVAKIDDWPDIDAWPTDDEPQADPLPEPQQQASVSPPRSTEPAAPRSTPLTEARNSPRLGPMSGRRTTPKATTVREPERRLAVLPRLPVRTQPAAPPQPRALPSVQVKSANTRHLAWMLGGKLGLARLAVAEGATSDEAKDWITEAWRLAEKLDIDPVRLGLQDRPTPGGAPERVLVLLESAAVASEALSAQHGSDHAALLEAALKANAMLVLFEERPDLVVPIATAVQAAAERAGLNPNLWNEPLMDLRLSGDADEVYAAVTDLFQAVESHLR